MPLTIKQTAFVEHVMRGATHRDAAVHAGYSAASAAVSGARLARHPKVVAELADRRAEARKAARAAAADHPARKVTAIADPKDYLLAAMNDVGVDLRLRMEAAKALLPFMHARMGEAGAKERRKDAAAKTGAQSKFHPSAPPANVVLFRKPTE